MTGEVSYGSLVAQDAVIGKGARIGAFCALGTDGPDSGAGLRIGADATIRSHSVIYRTVLIGDGFHAGHGALIREHTSIGDRVSVGSHTIVEHHVQLGNDVRLHSNCFVPEYSVLEDGAWLGPGVVITNSRYPNRPESKGQLQGVVLRQGATVGAGAVLLPGIVVGAGALIGAGAVVLADVPDGSTVVGNPGRLTS